MQTTKPLTPAKDSRSIKSVRLLLALIAVALTEILCFAPIIKHVGFYLDDWVMINYLSNAPHGFLETLKYYFSIDPRVVNRPIEAIHFIIMHKVSGLKPLGYHVFNGVQEIVAGLLLFTALLAVSRNRVAAFIAAVFFLLYPSHNTTHYWIVSSSVSLSLALYLICLNLDIQGALRDKPILHLVSALIFLATLLNYEVLLPLALVNALTVAFLKWQRSKSFKTALKASAICASSLGLSILSLFVYLKLIMPFLGPAWMHHIRLDPELMINTILKGIELNLPGAAFSYFITAAQTKLNLGFSTLEIFLMAGQVLCVSITIFLLGPGKKNTEAYTKVFRSEKQSAGFLIILGIITIPVSYIIFGINEEYMPTFLTIVNRVNTGASLGLAFITCGAALLVPEERLLFRTLKATVCALAVMFFTIVNWGLSMPFIISWQLQAQIVNCVKKNFSTLNNAKSIFLVNAPRYTGEAPIFDGVWDFEQMLQIYLDNKKVHGGVISERLLIRRENIKDFSLGFLCATYEWEAMYGIVSPTFEIVKISNPEQFINLVETKSTYFGPSKKLIQKWRTNL